MKKHIKREGISTKTITTTEIYDDKGNLVRRVVNTEETFGNYCITAGTIQGGTAIIGHTQIGECVIPESALKNAATAKTTLADAEIANCHLPDKVVSDLNINLI